MRRFPMSILAAAAVLTSLAVATGDVAAQQKTLKEQLVGTWSFVSSTGKTADGSPVWGANPKGLLIFAANGAYSTIIVRSDVPKFASNNRLQGTAEENKAAVHGAIATFGKYIGGRGQEVPHGALRSQHLSQQHWGRADATVRNLGRQAEDALNPASRRADRPSCS